VVVKGGELVEHLNELPGATIEGESTGIERKFDAQSLLRHTERSAGRSTVELEVLSGRDLDQPW